jgi:hypothetical protein
MPLLDSVPWSVACSTVDNLDNTPSDDTGLLDRFSVYFATTLVLATEWVLALECDRSLGGALTLPFVRELWLVLFLMLLS